MIYEIYEEILKAMLTLKHYGTTTVDGYAIDEVIATLHSDIAREKADAEREYNAAMAEYPPQTLEEMITEEMMEVAMA